MSADDRHGYVERARLVGRAALMVSVAPMLFYLWQAIGVPGIPALHFGNPFGHADTGLVVRIAAAPHDPLRVDHPVRIDRARVVAAFRGPRTIKPVVAPATSIQHTLPPPTAAKTPAARTPETTAATGPSVASDVVRAAPVEAPSTESVPVQVPTLPSVQIPPALPAVPAVPDVPALTTPPVLAPALP